MTSSVRGMFEKHTLVLAGIATTAAICLFLRSRKKASKYQGQQANTSSNAHPILQQQFNQASQQAAGLKNMTNGDKLMIYGLYKQALEGDQSTDAPSSLRVVAHAKYTAWGKFTGMTKEVAMTKYCEVIQHFSGGGKSVFAPDDDKADIVYPDDNSDDDISSENDNCQEQNLPISGFGMRQSTMTALHQGSEGVLSNSQDVNDSDENRNYEIEMPLHEYANKGNSLLLQKTIENGADVHKNDESGQTALHFAADKGHSHCVSLLIKAGADVNALDMDGITVLQSGVIGGHVETARLLMQAGANPDKKDKDGDSARSCIDDDDEEMINLFKKI